MAVEIVTREDLQQFKQELFEELKRLHPEKPPIKEWLKSSEVKRLLGVSHGKLQGLRKKGILSYSDLGGTLYYSYSQIQKVLEQNLITKNKTA